MNGEWYPVGMNDIEPGWQNLFRNNLAIQFIHRGLAYILLFLPFTFIPGLLYTKATDCSTDFVQASWS